MSPSMPSYIKGQIPSDAYTPASALSFIWRKPFFVFFPNIVFYLCKYFFQVLHWMFLEKDFFNSSFQHPMPAYVRPSCLSIITHPSVYMFKHVLVLYANRFKHFHTQFKNDIQTKRILQGLENILRGENSFSESTVCFKI